MPQDVAINRGDKASSRACPAKRNAKTSLMAVGRLRLPLRIIHHWNVLHKKKKIPYVGRPGSQVACPYHCVRKSLCLKQPLHSKSRSTQLLIPFIHVQASCVGQREPQSQQGSNHKIFSQQLLESVQAESCKDSSNQLEEAAAAAAAVAPCTHPTQQAQATH